RSKRLGCEEYLLRPGQRTSYVAPAPRRLLGDSYSPKVRGREALATAGETPALQKLLPVDEMTTPVLLPALLVGLGAERFFLAVADGLDVVGAHASLNQRITHGIRAAVAQSQVVLGRSPFVAVALYR